MGVMLDDDNHCDNSFMVGDYDNRWQSRFIKTGSGCTAVYGMLQDLGLSGYRCGVLHTRNQHILQYAEKVGIFQQAAAPVQLKLQELIKDKGEPSRNYSFISLNTVLFK